MTTLFLDHPLLLSLGLFVLLTATVEAGFRLAVLTSPDIDEERREQIAASRDALGILLSLLLGFTFAMALPRFDLRKQLVMDEANAIGTTVFAPLSCRKHSEARTAHYCVHMFRQGRCIRRPFLASHS